MIMTAFDTAEEDTRDCDDPAAELGYQRALEQLGIAHLQAANDRAEADLRENLGAVRARNGDICYYASPTPLTDSITARLLRQRDEARALVDDLRAEVQRLRGLLAAERRVA